MCDKTIYGIFHGQQENILFVAGYVLLVSCCFLLVPSCFCFIGRYVLFVTCYSLFVVHYLILIACYFLFIARYFLLIVCCCYSLEYQPLEVFCKLGVFKNTFFYRTRSVAVLFLLVTFSLLLVTFFHFAHQFLSVFALEA